MKLKPFVVLTLMFAAGLGLAQTLGINALPVYLCPGECFELDVAHDTLNPGYVYDSVYVFSQLESLATGSSGRWYSLIGSSPTLPQICNNAYFDAGRGEWVFGWDSVYIRADTNGVVAAETTIWVFHYPPDSGWVSAGGTTLCPAVAGTLFGKYLEVRGAFFWSFVVDTAVVPNDFVHPEIVDTTICIRPDHQAYWAPDTFSLSPTYIDTTYDPCPSLICTTFTLLPTDPVPDTTIIACRDFPDTVILTSSYPYDHNWIYNGTVIMHSTGTEDTLEITPAVCGTSWVYYEITGSGACAAARIDSVALWAPCSEYDVVVNSVPVEDTAARVCSGETLTVCLRGDVFEDSDICWDLPNFVECGRCVSFAADSSLWVRFYAADTFGCGVEDSVFVPVAPEVDFTVQVAGGCLGETVKFTLIPDSTVAAERAVFQFGDGSWEYVDSSDTAGNFIAVHRYDSVGIYTVYITLYDTAGCSRTDSVWVRQSEIVAHLTVDRNPACLGGEILLDASLSTVNPSGVLEYHFYDPAGSLIYSGSRPNCTDTVDSGGTWYVWVVDTAAACSAYASINVVPIWTEIYAPDTVLALAACERCVSLDAVAHNCTGEINYGFAEYDPAAGNAGGMSLLPENQFCVPAGGDSADSMYYLYSWCSECPDSRDSSLLIVRRVHIDASTEDTFACYGQPMPNLLTSIDVAPSYAFDSLWIQVVFDIDGAGEDTVVRWRVFDSLPDEFEHYPVSGNGILKYRFAIGGPSDCFEEFPARVTVRHPVAVLDILPGDSACVTQPVVLDASGSYSNCVGAQLCHRYFEQVGGVLLPLDGFGDSTCCVPSCSTYSVGTLEPGEHIFAVEVCMEDVPWCCDTAYETLWVCDTTTPVVGVFGECSPETILAGKEIQFTVLNADSFDGFRWNAFWIESSTVVDSSGTTVVVDTVVVSLGDSAEAEFVMFPEDTVDSVVVEVCGMRCSGACEVCDSLRYYIDYPPVARDIALTAVEDSCPFAVYVGDSVMDREGDSLVYSIVDGPVDVEISPAGTLYWNCPSNCDVGDNVVFVRVQEQSSCGAVCTLKVDINVVNVLAGITGVDSSAGFSCVDSVVVSGGEIFVRASGGCDYIGFDLRADDEDFCDCGFWSARRLFWLDVYPGGLVSGDIYTVPRGVYEDTIYYSDCHDTVSSVVRIGIPNHPPRPTTVPFDLWIPRGTDTVAVSSSDFSDIDGDVVSFQNYSLSNATNYSVTMETSLLRIAPSPNYVNFPGVPDTLTVEVTDGFGGNSEVSLLVWVYDPSEIEPEHRKPQTTRIVGAYPNPFNQTVAFEVENVKPQAVRLYVIDEAGRVVKNLFEGSMPAGIFRIKWDGTDGWGTPVPSGNYWVMFKSEKGMYSLSVQLVR